MRVDLMIRACGCMVVLLFLAPVSSALAKKSLGSPAAFGPSAFGSAGVFPQRTTQTIERVGTREIGGRMIIMYHVALGAFAATADADGNFWYSATRRMVRLNAKTLKATYYSIPSHQRPFFREPLGVAYDPVDKKTWFATLGRTFGSIDSVGRIVTYRGQGDSAAYGMTVGPDHRLWFTHGGAQTGFLEAVTVGGAKSLYPLPLYPLAVTTGSDGNLWTYGGSNLYIAKVTALGSVTDYPLDPQFDGGVGSAIASGSDGRIWFVQTSPGSATAIARIDTDGSHLRAFFLPPSHQGYAGDLVSAPDGNLYFTVNLAGSPRVMGIGEITTAGKITLYTVPGIGSLNAIAAASDGRSVWAFPNAADGGTAISLSL